MLLGPERMTLRLEAFSCSGQREEVVPVRVRSMLSFCALCHCCKLHLWPSWQKKLSHMNPRCQYPWTQVSRGWAGRGSASSTISVAIVVETAKSSGTVLQLCWLSSRHAESPAALWSCRQEAWEAQQPRNQVKSVLRLAPLSQEQEANRSSPYIANVQENVEK